MKNRRLELVKRKFISDKGMWLAVAFLLFLIVMAVGIKFTDLDPNAMNLQKMLAAPDKENLFGRALMELRDEIRRLCKNADKIDWEYTEYLKCKPW